MLFKEPKGLEKPSDVEFKDLTIWIQCHNLPVACMNPQHIHKIGEAVGKVEEIDTGEGGNCLGQYARVRVTRDVEKPLQRCVKITTGIESQTVLIRYERLPEFCQACGRVGHAMRVCPDQTADKTKRTYGVWLRATRTADMRRSRRTGTSRGMDEVLVPMENSTRMGQTSEGGHQEGRLRNPNPPSSEEVDGLVETRQDEETLNPSRSNQSREGIYEESSAHQTQEMEIQDKSGAGENSTLRQKEGATRGWKRRAREQKREPTSYELGAYGGGTNPGGAKRGSTGQELVDGGRPAKVARKNYDGEATKKRTAEAGEQPRRSP